VIGRVVKVEMTFYSSRGWELGGSGMVDYGGGVNSMLQFYLERRDDGMKRCWKMKRKQ
jgi:hypothetical protein